ncbi:GroES-like protein [Lophiostoma macrostomum CBS 122681]|uniref:GroES-like protein n=1 Tax=Lophiostoma macrostomum CBS 122681 TaxID=1314788 RepID=A0A6A6TCT7_9PLEO|nr:GroES-like protein [Lophiostoma macrostomum CBS 122681]
MADAQRIPILQTALTFNEKGMLHVDHTAHVPQIQGDEILIKNEAVSVNPVDCKMEGGFSKQGHIGGCDFCGTVVAVGPTLKRNVKVGDRVSGAVMGSDPLDPSSGSFATYVAAPSDITLTIPPSISASVGASLGTVWFTIGQALFQKLLPPGGITARPFTPAATPTTVLVYGGSTSVGTAALQLLKLAGLRPICTCSPRNNDLVRSYGAEEVFDYRDPDCAANIKKATKNNLRFALDCITTKESIGIIYKSIGRAGGRYTSLDPYWEATAATRTSIKTNWTLGISMLGRKITWPAPYEREASKEDRDFGEQWAHVLQRILDEGLLKPHPLRVKESATWEDVLSGLAEVKAGTVSGEKLVFRF